MSAALGKLLRLGGARPGRGGRMAGGETGQVGEDRAGDGQVFRSAGSRPRGALSTVRTWRGVLAL